MIPQFTTIEGKTGAYRGGRGTKIAGILGFALGLGTFFHLYIGYRTCLAELLYPLVYLCFLGETIKVLELRITRWAVFFYLLFVFGVCLGDVVNDTISEDTFKAIARPSFVLACIVASSVLVVKNRNYLILFFVGAGCGSIVNYMFNTTQESSNLLAGDYGVFVFKYYFVVDRLMSLLLYYFFNRSSLIFALVIAVGFGLVSQGGARSLSGVWLVNSCGLLSSLYGTFLASSGRLKIAISGLLLLSSGLSALWLYKNYAITGIFGEQARIKAESSLQRDRNSVVEILLDGRTEAYAAIKMIRDNPIFGFGSNFDSRAYLAEAYNEVGRGKLYSSKDAAGHSILFSSWAYNGLLTVPFWLYISFLALKGGLEAIVFRLREACLILPVATSFLWALFFSPLSIHERVFAGVIVAFVPYIRRKD